MLYGKSIIATGYRQSDGLPRCPICGETVTAESETVMPEGGSGELSPVSFVQCEHCHAKIHWSSNAVPPELEPYCDIGGNGDA